MSNSVKVFASTDSGAPVLSGAAGALIAVLDACLQNGYGEVTIDSLVVASDVATVTDSTGHGFTMLGAVGPVVRISGATPAGLNGDWRITVVSATQFTFTTSGITDQTASGTIVVKRAPAGFTKEFSGTNLAAYRSDDVTGTRLYLRVNDTDWQWVAITGYETMTGISTGTGLFPTNNFWYHKSTANNSTGRVWTLIADSRAFYLFSQGDGSNWFGRLFFGDINSFKSGDAYSCGIISHPYDKGENYLPNVANNTSGHTLARSYTQLGGAVVFGKFAHRVTDTVGASGANYPNPTDNSFICVPIECWESATNARGTMPGIYCPLHSGLTHGSVIELNSGKTLLIHGVWQFSSNAYSIAVDISGPWR